MGGPHVVTSNSQSGQSPGSGQELSDLSEPSELLHSLLVSLFGSEDEFRRWIALGPEGYDLVLEFPPGTGSTSSAIYGGLEVLRRRGYVDAAFFTRLITKFSRRKEEIRRAAAAWGTPLAPDFADPDYPDGRPAPPHTPTAPARIRRTHVVVAALVLLASASVAFLLDPPSVPLAGMLAGTSDMLPLRFPLYRFIPERPPDTRASPTFPPIRATKNHPLPMISYTVILNEIAKDVRSTITVRISRINASLRFSTDSGPIDAAVFASLTKRSSELERALAREKFCAITVLFGRFPPPSVLETTPC